MGNKSSSTSQESSVAQEAPVPDFYYKGKPEVKDLPAWFKSIKLVPEELPHLKTVTDRQGQKEHRFSHELSTVKKNNELARKIALDCSKRCIYSYTGEVDEFGVVTRT